MKFLRAVTRVPDRRPGTFPFPKPDPHTVVPELEEIGERLYEVRAKYMVETDQGLTQTYNKLKDAQCNEAAIDELRGLHIEMDRAVLAAYGWADIDEKALESFQDEVIDRLFVLNAERAKEEKLAGKSAKKSNSRGRRAVKKPRDTNQLSLVEGGD